MKTTLEKLREVFDFCAYKYNPDDTTIDWYDFNEWLLDVEWKLQYDDGTYEGILFDLSESPSEAFWQLVCLYIEENKFNY